MTEECRDCALWNSSNPHFGLCELTVRSSFDPRELPSDGIVLVQKQQLVMTGPNYGCNRFKRRVVD